MHQMYCTCLDWLQGIHSPHGLQCAGGDIPALDIPGRNMAALHKYNTHIALTLQLHTLRLLVHAKLAAAFENLVLNVPRVQRGTVPSVERPWF